MSDAFFTAAQRSAGIARTLADAEAAQDDVNTIAAATLNVVKALQQARARIAELEDALVGKTAHAEGLTAMCVAYRDHNPDSPLRANSGKRYEDGRNKPQVRLVYEAAHDACLTRLGIANPATRRAD